MSGLPPGRLIGFYGDDFTGSAAVMEVLTFAGFETVLFLDVPTPEQLAAFPGARAIGIAGTARARNREWMDAHLPAIFAALAGLETPLVHYKICSTFDSSPEIGSIGHALDLAQPYWAGNWHPLLIAAPVMGRYQAFSQLFAAAGDDIYRLDRHPVMSRHPTTPMAEADVRTHLGRQTSLPIGRITLPDWRADGGAVALKRERAAGRRVIALDAIEENDMATAGRLIWSQRGNGMLAVGSQGIDYALVAHWQAIGALPPPPPARSAGRVETIIAVSGSVSATTAEQIGWAERNGFAAIALEAADLLDPASAEPAMARVVETGLRSLSAGSSPLIHSARGPDDPAIGRLRRALAQCAIDPSVARQRIGDGLGEVLARLLMASGLRRAVISGGDTSGHAGLKLDVHALTALAPTIPGAALLKAHRRSGDPLELALKGGQMGTPDYFGWIRDGGGPR